jgi:RimJ/RimL family protein N-acetyltransferase
MEQLTFLWNNITRSMRMPVIGDYEQKGFLYCGMKKNMVAQFATLYSNTNGGSSNLRRHFYRLYQLCGQKMVVTCMAASSGDFEVLAGIDMFYFNLRDIRENTIHEGYIGVQEKFRKVGIATSMRRVAMEHFSSLGIKGISTRISFNNTGSIRSAEKLGFSCVERYHDHSLNEERGYFVLWF